jgi:hypothetical protein
MALVKVCLGGVIQVLRKEFLFNTLDQRIQEVYDHVLRCPAVDEITESASRPVPLEALRFLGDDDLPFLSWHCGGGGSVVVG